MDRMVIVSDWGEDVMLNVDGKKMKLAPAAARDVAEALVEAAQRCEQWTAKLKAQAAARSRRSRTRSDP